MYDAEIGRWHAIDPAIEDNHHNYTPYAYVYNNPILLLDMYGLDSTAAAEVTQAAEETVDEIDEKYNKDGTKPAQCNRGVSTAFSKIFNSDALDGMTANEIVEFLSNSENWELVSVDDVQELANDGEFIIAGKQNNEVDDNGNKKSGHVAVVVPGEEASSGNWGGSAPVGMDTGSNKYWSKNGMNYSWSSKSGVQFFKYVGSSNKTYNACTLNTVTVVGKGLTQLKPKTNFVKIN